MNENTTRSNAEAIGQSTDFGSERPRTESDNNMQGRAQEVAGKAKDAAEEYGQKAQEQLDKGTDQAASGLEQAAGKLREQTETSEGMPAQAGMKVAEGMESAAGYLREHNTEDMLADVEQYVKAHPTTALAGAVVAGFFVGRILR
jgi:ElaB/YqjD/DUF883 family membrane-anchored ribosome-binding protein